MTPDEEVRPIAELGFEAAYTRLELTVSRLEAPDLPLEEALRLYEEGIALVARCSALLEAADEKMRSVRPADAQPLA